eukprot:1065863-Prymnesium_polylepis.2
MDLLQLLEVGRLQAATGLQAGRHDRLREHGRGGQCYQCGAWECYQGCHQCVAFRLVACSGGGTR